MNLSIKHVSKQYSAKKWGVRDINLELNSGVVGLLGPNGAGKSTLMRMLATISKPTEGEIIWNGVNIQENPNVLRKDLGYLPQSFGVYPNLNAVEFLTYMAAIKGLDSTYAKKRIDMLIEMVNLQAARRVALKGHSGGMRQRVGIAQALLNDPKLLIVDEPTVGLDPEERVRFRNLLSDISGERIIILSTHIVSDIEATATDIALISQGNLLEHLPPEEMLQNVEGKVWTWVIPSNEFMQARELYQISNSLRRSDGVHIRVISEEKPTETAQTVPANLEDAYLYLIGQHDETAEAH